MKDTVFLLCEVGVAVWILSYGYFTCLSIVSERIGKKISIAYFKSLINQDIQWLETQDADDEKNLTPQELSSNMNRQCQTIQQSLGEKMGHIYLSFAMSASGFILAFFRGWLLTLIILGTFPLLLIVTYFMTKSMKSGFDENQRAQGKSFGHAE